MEEDPPPGDEDADASSIRPENEAISTERAATILYAKPPSTPQSAAPGDKLVISSPKKS